MDPESTINPSLINGNLYISNKNNENRHHQQDNHHHTYEEEHNETEENLIENYHFLTQHCGVLRQSSTTGLSNVVQQKQTCQQTPLRHNSFNDKENNNTNNKNTNNSELDHTLISSKPWCSQLDDINNNSPNYSTTPSRVPPTIYYDDTDDSESSRHQSFSLIKMFTRIKTRLGHDKRYRPKSSHQLLREEDIQEWEELTKNVRAVLTKVLITDNLKNSQHSYPKKVHSRKGSCKKARETRPVLSNENDEEDKIQVEINDDFHTNDNQQSDEVVWNKYISCSRGPNYRRSAVCKIVDREQHQGQLVYFYGVANNILIDENLKASGLG